MSSTIKIKAPEPLKFSLLKFSLLKAAINCEHHITGSVIRLVHDPEAPGHNALNQLGNRLDAEVRDQLAARDAQWQEMVGPVVEALQLAKNSLVAFKFMPGPSNAWEDHDEANLAAVNAALSAITEE